MQTPIFLNAQPCMVKGQHYFFVRIFNLDHFDRGPYGTPFVTILFPRVNNVIIPILKAYFLGK